MDKKDLNRLKHMLDACQAARQHMGKRQKSDLNHNRMLLSAIIRELEIIGEAASTVSEETRKDLRGLPWKQMVGMRNRLIHAYFDINIEIIWMTITDELPKLISELEKVLSSP